MENQAEVLTAEELIASISQQAPSDTSSEVLVFTADDVAKAREQEKAKLYPQMEKMKAELEMKHKIEKERIEKEKRDLEENSKIEQLRKLKEERILQTKRKKEMRIKLEQFMPRFVTNERHAIAIRSVTRRLEWKPNFK